MNTYELVVGNLGQTWIGMNGAQAYREFGAARASASQPGGRDGWEPVTLFKNGRTLLEYTPGPFWFFEVTDTFSGEASYCWTNRYKVQGKNGKHALRRFMKEAGWQGARYVGPDRWDIPGAAICFFRDYWDYWEDDNHSHYLNVKEI